MASTPLPSLATRSTAALTGPLQTLLAAAAVCVLYWSVGINDTPDATSGSSAPAVRLQQVGNTTAVQSAVPAAYTVSGQVR